MKLADMKRGKLKQPTRWTFMGPPGVGKSTLAAAFPCPVVIDVEDGSGHLDVTRAQFDKGRHIPSSYAEVEGFVDRLIEEPHGFKTLIIDTVDAMEALVWSHVCEVDSGRKTEANPKARKLISISDYGYQQGYTRAKDQFRVLLARMDRLRTQRKMQVVLVAHTQAAAYKNPMGEDYDRFVMRCHKHSASAMMEWSDVVGFVQLETGVKSADGKAKGFSTGRRIATFAACAAFDAKARIDLPDEVEIPLGDPLANMIPACQGNESIVYPGIEIRKAIDAEVDRIGSDELTAKVREAMAAADGDETKLQVYLDDLKARS